LTNWMRDYLMLLKLFIEQCSEARQAVNPKTHRRLQPEQTFTAAESATLPGGLAELAKLSAASSQNDFHCPGNNR